MTLNKGKYIHLAIMFVLTFGISILPPFGQVTVYGMKTIGVFVGVLYGWIAFDLFWSSIYGFIMIAALGLNSVGGAFAAGLGNDMIINVLLSMAFAIAVDMAGVTDVMANWLLKRKIIRKSPWFLICGILIVGGLIGSIGPSLAAIFLLWAITIKIADYCDIKKGDPLLSFMIMMIPAVTMTSTFIFPFRSGTLIFLSYLYQVTDVPFETVPFIVFGIVTIVLIFVLMILACKVLFRLDVSKFNLPESIIREIEKATVNQKQKMSFGILIIYVLVLLLASILHFPGSNWINQMGVGGISAIAILALAVMNFEGKGYINLPKLFSKLDWSLLFLLAVTYPIADCLKHEDAGIMPTILTYVTPVVTKLGIIPFMIVCMIILGFVTQVTHNIVLGAIFMPMLLPILESMGGNIYTLWFILFLTLNFAYCTPAGSFQSALVFGNDHMERKHAFALGFVLLFSAFVIFAVVGIPLGNVLFTF